MRFFALAIAVFSLVCVAYVNFKAPSHAAVFSDDTHYTAAASPAPLASR